MFRLDLGIGGMSCASCVSRLEKAYADLSQLAGEHSGADFWRALARYVFKNLSDG